MTFIKKLVPFAAVLTLSVSFAAALPSSSADLNRLLPVLSGWHFGEEPRTFGPENLFEYIDGGAEAYLSYDFKELVVGQYAADASKAAVTVEIYDMGTALNAFGIYGAERFPDSRFLDVGSQGYAEDGVLNFLHGRYYVKLLCFDCEGDGSATLLGFARDIIAKSSGEPDGFPPLLQSLPRRGLVANSEKFILSNVLGFGFLHDGYLASYSPEGAAFDGFIVAAASPEEVESMLKQYLDFQTRNRWTKTEFGEDVHLRGASGDDQYLGRQGRFLFGLIRGKGVSEEAGRAFLDEIRKAVDKIPR
jgi:hypothetical protein